MTLDVKYKKKVNNLYNISSIDIISCVVTIISCD